MSIRFSTIAIALAFTTAGATAQTAAPPAPEHMPMQGCMKQMQPHDHGAERSVPAPRQGCTAMQAAAAAAQPAAPAPGRAAKFKNHDHGRMHKLM